MQSSISRVQPFSCISPTPRRCRSLSSRILRLLQHTLRGIFWGLWPSDHPFTLIWYFGDFIVPTYGSINNGTYGQLQFQEPSTSAAFYTQGCGLLGLSAPLPTLIRTPTARIRQYHSDTLRHYGFRCVVVQKLPPNKLWYQLPSYLGYFTEPRAAVLRHVSCSPSFSNFVFHSGKFLKHSGFPGKLKPCLSQFVSNLHHVP
jgi:hypothetical protein